MKMIEVRFVVMGRIQTTPPVYMFFFGEKRGKRIFPVKLNVLDATSLMTGIQLSKGVKDDKEAPFPWIHDVINEYLTFFGGTLDKVIIEGFNEETQNFSVKAYFSDKDSEKS